jgi:hypothetical protein
MVNIRTKEILFHITATLLMLLSSQINAAVDARIDRNPIRESETITLIISVEDNDAQPDLAPLNSDFEVLGTSQSRSMSIINGAASSKVEWHITLSPKQSGRLIIPAIAVGQEATQAITLAVLANKDPSGTQPSGDIFIEYTADTDKAYVQQQLLVSVKLFFRVNLNGQLSEPTADKTLIQKLGEDQQYETTLQGERYNVVERKYAVFPQASGKLTLPEVVFTGVMEDMNSFFGNGKRIRIKGQALSFNVLQPPSTFAGAWWLPAQSVRISETWSPDPPTFRVGEPITRTITLSAEGLTAAQLPELPQPILTRAKLYPDQPQTSNTPSAQGIRGEKTEKLAIVPTQPGDMTLPELTIHWWNTQTNHMETATLPARTVHVEPSANNTSAAPAPTTHAAPQPSPSTPPNTPSPQSLATPVKEKIIMDAGIWPWLSAALAGLWVITLLLWLIEYRRRAHRNAPTASPSKPDTSTTLRHTQQQLREALRSHQVAPIRTALLAWGQSMWPEQPPNTLEELSQRAASPSLHRAINVLNQAAYSAQPAPWQSDELNVALGPWLKNASSGRATPIRDTLPPLFPNKR